MRAAGGRRLWAKRQRHAVRPLASDSSRRALRYAGVFRRPHAFARAGDRRSIGSTQRRADMRAGRNATAALWLPPDRREFLVTGDELATIVVTPPGPKSRQLAKELRDVESRNVTFVSEEFPVFFESGAGANLTDVDGNVYVDLSGAFAASAARHSSPNVAAAIARQARTLMHGMGDVHPNRLKVELARTLCELAPGDGPKRVIFASSGAEAVEAAIKTAAVATGKPGVVCFTGAYHGLTYGALALTDRSLLRAPFVRQLGGFATRVPFAYCHRCPIGLDYPACAIACLRLVEHALDGPDGADIGAVIGEPIQARGGDVTPPPEWLAGLRELCDRGGVLL